MFEPRLDILPDQQRRLWSELRATPPQFTLYGGTAIALRLGHRESIDFDFFSATPFAPRTLMSNIPYLDGATLLQSAANTLTRLVDRQGPVQVSYFGGLRLGQVALPDVAEGPGILVASLLDLAGLKAAVVTQRAEAKDYLDLHALLTVARIDLPTMLASACIIYGETFSPLLSLKAISYHDEPALAALPVSVRSDLTAAARSVKPHALPQITCVRPWS